MIEYLLQTNNIVRYHSNCGHPRFFVHGSFLYCHDGESIQGHILLTPILKPHQEPTLPRDSLDHTSQLLPQPPGKSFPYLLLQLTYLFLHHHPHQDLVPLPSALPLCVGGRLKRSSKNRSVHGESIVFPGALSEFLECMVDFSGFFVKQNPKTKNQDCMQTYLFLAIDDSNRQLA